MRFADPENSHLIATNAEEQADLRRWAVEQAIRACPTSATDLEVMRAADLFRVAVMYGPAEVARQIDAAQGTPSPTPAASA